MSRTRKITLHFQYVSGKTDTFYISIEEVLDANNIKYDPNMKNEEVAISLFILEEIVVPYTDEITYIIPLARVERFGFSTRTP